MTPDTAQKVEEKWASYPDNIQSLLLRLRELIVRVAQQHGITDLKETLKWGELSYICSTGSTIRIDWKAKEPEHYAIYFNCKTCLIDTFKTIYPNDFCYVGNRAIIFGLCDNIPQHKLEHCISMALRYHQLKKNTLLG